MLISPRGGTGESGQENKMASTLFDQLNCIDPNPSL